MSTPFPKAVAGPAIPKAAAPGYADPLSRLRGPDPVAGSGPNSGRAPGLSRADAAPRDSGPGFAILGDQGTELLDEAEPADASDFEFVPFGGQAGTPLTNDPPVASGIAGVTPRSNLAELASALVNGLPASGAAGPGGQAGQVNDGGLLSSVVDAALTDVVVDILSPEFEADGLVTFSIAGFGSFALLSLGEKGGLFFVDMERGTAFKIYDDPGPTGGQSASISIPGAPQPGGNVKPSGESHALERVLDFLDRYIFPVVTSPITLAAIVLFMMIWVLWRISARE